MRAERTVICCLADDALFNRVSSALAGQGLQTVRWTHADEATAARLPDGVALIHDLDAPGGGIAADTFHDWRSAHPGRPVLLYYRPTMEVAPLVGELATLGGVVAWAQTPNVLDESRQFAQLTRQMLSRVPHLLVRAVLDTIRPAAPAAVGMFVDALVYRLERREAGAPGVADVAAEAGVRPWAVRRACRAARLPTPEPLVEWLTFIYVIALADWERISITQAAITVGLTEKYMRGLRVHLLPQVSRLAGTLSEYILTRAIMGLAEACGLQRVEASAATERLTGVRAP